MQKKSAHSAAVYIAIRASRNKGKRTMSYKTMLVHVDGSRHADQRYRVAAWLAQQHGAHLIGAAATGLAAVSSGSLWLSADSPGIAPYLQNLTELADRSLDRFERVVGEIGVDSIERRRSDDDAASSIALQGRYADLVIVGQNDVSERASYGPDFPESVVMNSGRPVLVVPYANAVSTLGERVLVAWNESTEAVHAVAMSMPFLKRAARIYSATFTAHPHDTERAEEMGAEIGANFARHGISVEVHATPLQRDAGNALLNLATDIGADLIVMGCYGHSRAREILLGGATRTLLESMTVPVLMVH